jgi:hypothetical protein
MDVPAVLTGQRRGEFGEVYRHRPAGLLQRMVEIAAVDEDAYTIHRGNMAKKKNWRLAATSRG